MSFQPFDVAFSFSERLRPKEEITLHFPADAMKKPLRKVENQRKKEHPVFLRLDEGQKVMR